MRYVTMLRLSQEGRSRYAEAGTLFTKCLEITDSVGGKVLESYASSGQFDFVSISEYPTPEVAFEARLQLYRLGIFDMVDSHEIFDMDLFLAKA